MILSFNLKQETSKYLNFIFIFFIIFFYTNTSLALSDEQFNKIKKLIEQQNIEKSFELLKTYNLGEKKLSPKALLLFGKIYLELDNPQKANRYFEEVIFSSTSFDEFAYAGIARSEFMFGNLLKSKEMAEVSLNINPNLLESKVILAKVLSELNYDARS